jgi:hypothetical protein
MKYIFTILFSILVSQVWALQHWSNEFVSVEKKIKLGQYKDAIGACDQKNL